LVTPTKGLHKYTVENTRDPKTGISPLEFNDVDVQEWHRVSFVPTWANDKKPDGSPIIADIPEVVEVGGDGSGVEIRYKMRIKVKKPQTMYPVTTPELQPLPTTTISNGLYAMYLVRPSILPLSETLNLVGSQGTTIPLTRTANVADMSDPSKPYYYMIQYGDMLTASGVFLSPVTYGALQQAYPSETFYLSATYTYGETTSIKVSGVQVELGKNMSYFRMGLGEGTIPAAMVQAFNPDFPLETGITSKHIQHYDATTTALGLPSGILTDHLADGAVTTEKLAVESVTWDILDTASVGFVKMAQKYRQPLTGTVNGVNTVFTIADRVTPGSEMIYLNGMLISPDSDYTISYGTSSATVTFVKAPGTTDRIFINYYYR
jgi:hypothetical protein